MKTYLLIPALLIVLYWGCGSDGRPCVTESTEIPINLDDFFDKNTLPFVYEFGDSLGILAQISMDNRNEGNTPYNDMNNCPQNERSVNFNATLTYNQSQSTCDLSFGSRSTIPVLSFSSNDCAFSGFWDIYSSESTKVSQITDFEFAGQTYPEVLKYSIQNNLVDLQEMVLAKGQGFLYITINGESIAVK